MATLKRSDLEKLLSSFDGDEIEIDGFLSQEKVNEIVKALLAKESAKQSEIARASEGYKAQMAALQAEIDTLKNAKDSEGKSEIERLQVEFQKQQQLMDNWKVKAQEQEKRYADLQQRHREDFLERQLQAQLLKLGANQNFISDAVMIAKAKIGTHLDVVENNGSMKLVAKDPTLDTPEDLPTVAQKFLDNHPHFASAKPPGGPQGNSKPTDKPKEPQPTTLESVMKQAHGSWGGAVLESVKKG